MLLSGHWQAPRSCQSYNRGWNRQSHCEGKGSAGRMGEDELQPEEEGVADDAKVQLPHPLH